MAYVGGVTCSPWPIREEPGANGRHREVRVTTATVERSSKPLEGMRGIDVAKPGVYHVRLHKSDVLWLLEHNTHNVPVQQSLVDKYTADMQAGRWRFNGDTIRISKSMQLLDGQHRLWASISAEYDPLESVVVTGLPDEIMATIDIGRTRKGYHILDLQGVVNPTIVSGLVNTWWRYRNGWRRQSTSVPNIVELASTDTQIQTAAEFAANLKQERGHKLLPPAVLGALHYIIATESHVPEPVARLTDLLTQVCQAQGGTAFPVGRTLYRYLANNQQRGAGRVSQQTLLAVCLKAWNLHVQNREVQVLAWRKTEDYPHPL